MPWTFFNSSGEAMIQDGTMTIANNTNNRVVTATGAAPASLNGESALTFDGTTLTIPGQLAFPATQSASTGANVQDDYEEGTFTPVFANAAGSGGDGNETYNYQFGSYVKIGKMVWIQCRINFNNNNGGLSGDVYIQGLPFASINTTNNWFALACGNGAGWATGTAGYSGAGYINYNASRINVHLWDGTLGSSGLQFSELSADGGTTFSGCYMAQA